MRGYRTTTLQVARLRTSAPKTIAGYEVAEVVDYDADGTGLPRADVLEYRLVNGAKLMVRPSGTEPKIKVYILTKGADASERDANLAKYSAWVNTLA